MITSALALLASLASLAFAAPAPKAVPNELIVRYKPSTGDDKRSAALARVPNAARVRELGLIDGALVHFSGTTTTKAIAALRKDPNVLYAEPNYEVHIDRVPNDPRFGELYGMRNTGQTGGTPGADIRATLAWDLFTGDPNLKVGVIDTGVDYTHPDLVANIWTNPGEVAGNGIDDDHNGYVDDVHGYDFANHDSNPMDDHGHGTHVSGTIAGTGDNGLGVVGVNWRLKIVAIKFLSAGGGGTTAGAIEAVQYAVAAGVRLTSNSWGGGGYSEGLFDAIQAAGAAGQLFVAAAGNASTNTDFSPVYPADYDSPYIISVGATDHNDHLAYFSNYGVNSVDLAAPGVDILSTWMGGGYNTISGTSMATPHVSGVVALAAGRFPFATNLALKELVLSSCDSIPALIGQIHGARRLNAFQTVMLPDSIRPAPVVDLAVSSVGSTAIGLTWTATGDDSLTDTARAYDLRWSIAPIDEGNFALANPVTVLPPGAPGTTEAAEVTGLAYNTTHFFALKVMDELGNTSALSNVVTVATVGVPLIDVTPTSLAENVLTGDVTTQQLTVRNVGSGRLDFTAPTPEQLLTSALHAAALSRVEPDPAPSKGDPDTRVGFVGGRGPDAAGYRWRSSDDPTGPAFQWIDIAANGTAVPFTREDELSAPVSLGFELPFYGRRFSEVRIGSNGYLTFTGTNPWTVNSPLPTNEISADIVAPWWRDLGLGGPRSVLYRQDGSRFVVSFLEVPSLGSDGTKCSFQVILEADGRVRFEYLSLGATNHLATTGIQAPTRDKGLLVAFNAPYVHDRQAIEFVPLAQWLSVSPTSGHVAAGGSTQLDVTFDATGLFGGDYSGAVLLASNDLAHALTRIPAALHVTGAPDIALSRDTLGFGSLFIGATKVDSVRIQNVGTDQLHVSAISSTPAVFTVPAAAPFVLSPGQSLTLPVSFTPAAALAYTGTLTVVSDDHDEPAVIVDLSGTGLVPPDIAASPSLLAAELFTGGNTDQTLTIQNTGLSDLVWKIGANRPRVTAAVGPPVPVPANLQGDTPNETNPTPGEPRAHAFYSGTQLSFGITGLGEIMPLQSPIGSEHLAWGTFLSGYTIAYVGGGVDHLGYAVYWTNFNLVPFSYQEIENTPTRVIVKVVAHTSDGFLAIERTFTFRRDQRYVTVDTHLANLSGLPLENVVFKEDADWDVDGQFSNHWNYDRSRNLVHATGTHVAGIASEQTPAAMDINGWNDWDRRPTTIDFPVGPVLSFDGLEVLHFDLGTLAPSSSQDLRFAYGVGNTLAELQDMMDQAVGSPAWLRFTPDEGVIPAGGSLAVNAHFDATGLNGGTYAADVHLASNDPDEGDLLLAAQLHVTGAASLVVEPDSLYFGQPFAGTTHDDTLTVRNLGTDVLNITGIGASGPPWSTPAGPGSLAPGASRKIPVHYAPTVRGAYPGLISITSNDPYHPVLQVPLMGFARIPPDIAVAPADISADLLTGDTATRTITITNSDAQELFWTASVGTPAVVATSPVFGASPPSPDKTPRIEPPPPPPPGDIFTEDAGPIPHVASIHTPGYVVQDGTLEQALANLDAGAAELTATIPGRYDFFEGEVGNSIGDGGDDMYDGGNFLGTEFGNLSYSNGVIVASPIFGSGGRYFTRKYPGLFVLVADHGGVNTFTITGNLGADGGGNVDGSVLQLSSAGVNYRAFVKRVFNAGDPSVNHMVIVADAPAATHAFSTNTNDDFHQVTGLASTRRIYYLLYAGAGGGYIDDASALEILKTFIRLLRPLGPWLAVTPSAGVLSPGAHVDLAAQFRAAGLATGDLLSDVHIESDDPDESDLVVRAHLHVTGAPDIAVSADSLEFGPLYVGAIRRDTVDVSNDGTDPLSVSSVSIAPSEFHAATAPFTLSPGQKRSVVVTFAPTGPGDFAGALSFASDDHDEPTKTVVLHGVALVAPDLTVSPDSLVAELFTDDTLRTTLHLGNVGGSPLVFQLENTFDDSTAAPSPTVGALAALLPPADGAPWPGGSGAMGPFSRTGTNPVIRASASGARVLLITTTDVSQSIERALNELGQAYDYVFTSNFAGVPIAAYNTILVAMDGGMPNPPDVLALANAAAAGKTVILFGGTGYPGFADGMQSYLLHHVGVPGWTISPTPHFTLTAPFDPLAKSLPPTLNFANLLASYYMLHVSDAGAAIVARNGNNDPVLLHKPIGPGSLVYFLDSPYSYYWTDAGDYSFLRQVVRNTLDWAGTRWLTFEPGSGVVPAGSELGVVARFDATRLLGGHYRGTLHIHSDDPDESDVALATHLHVIGRPHIAVTPDTLHFGSLFVGATRVDTVKVQNTGTDMLNVTGLAIAPSHFLVPPAPFSLAPGASRLLPVTFAPTAPGVFAGTLDVSSDDPLNPVVSVKLLGEGLVAPDIDIDPGDLVANLNTGDTLRMPLVIRNVGGSDLVFQLTARKSASPAPASALPVSASPTGPTRNTTDPTTGAPVVQANYSGPSLSFGLTANGEIMPLQSPLGYEHLAWGSFLSGYTLAYRGAGGVDHLAYSVYDGVFNIMPVRYQELENTPTRVVVDVETRTADGILGVHRLVTFRRDQKSITVKTRLENLTGTPLTDVVYKEDADWDVDGTFGNTWNYDFSRNMTYATNGVHYAAIAAEQPPAKMDLYGWNDYGGRATFVDYPVGPVVSFDGLEVLHFDLGSLEPAQSQEVRVAYGVGSSLTELQAIMDDAVGLPAWLRLEPSVGIIPAGGSLAVSARFDAAALGSGFYNADLHVTSNDPDEADVVRLAQLHVIGVPRIVWAPDSIAFGNLFVGASRTDTVVVTNTGSDILHITSVSAAPGDFHAPAGPFDVIMGATLKLPVTFNPTAVGAFTGQLVIDSDAPNAPSANVKLTGSGLIPPVAGVSPSSLTYTMPEGGQQDQNLVISNTGGSDLLFSIGGAGGASLLADAHNLLRPEDIHTAKTIAAQDRTRAITRSATVAPKLAQADVVDTTGTAVLVIADGGTELDVVPLLTSAGYHVTQIGDDSFYDGSNPPLAGFKLVVLLDGPNVLSDMPAGGQTAIRDFVQAGGKLLSTEWLSYEVSIGSYAILQPCIPLTWGDFGFGLFTWSVVTAHPVTAGVSPSFNVSTTANLGTANSGTVLVRSGDGSPMVITKHFGSGDIVHFACAGNYNGYQPFLVPDMARLFRNAAAWLVGLDQLVPDPGSGSVPAGGSQTVRITANAGLLPSGTHDRSLIVSTNDPLHLAITVPVSIVVTAAPDISAQPAILAFGTRAIGTAGVDTVAISNPGSLALHVTSVTTAAPFSAPMAGFTLAAGGIRKIPVTFAPTATGPFTGSLTIASDDPDEGSFVVGLTGTGASSATLSSMALDCTVEPGGTRTKELNLANPLGAPMSWWVELVPTDGGAAGTRSASAAADRAATGRFTPAQAEPADWFSVTPASGTLAANGSVTLTAHFDAKQLENGRFTAVLRVVSDDAADALMTIPIGLSVESARAATGDLALALHGFVPNPPVRDLVVGITLPDGDAARLELLDLAGRRVRGVDVGSLGAGRHTVSLGGVGSLRSGVYLVRLQHRGRTLVSKCVLMR